MEQIYAITTMGILIQKTRKEQGLSQEQLAGLCGVGVRFLRELEHGKETCHIGKVLQVLEALGLQLMVTARGERWL